MQRIRQPKRLNRCEFYKQYFRYDTKQFFRLPHYSRCRNPDDKKTKCLKRTENRIAQHLLKRRNSATTSHIEVIGNGKIEFREFEIIKLFADRKEAETFAKENNIIDANFVEND